MTTREVMKAIPGLKRDVLYYWERKRWITKRTTDEPEIKSTKGKKKKKAGTKRDYPPDQVEKIRLLFAAYKAGFTAEMAGKILKGAASLGDPKLQIVMAASREIWESASLGDPDHTLQIAVTKLFDLV